MRDFYKIFFLCESLDDADPAPGLEATEARFFGLDDLPPLSTGRVLRKDIEAAFLFRDDPESLLLFD